MADNSAELARALSVYQHAPRVLPAVDQDLAMSLQSLIRDETFRTEIIGAWNAAAGALKRTGVAVCEFEHNEREAWRTAIVRATFEQLGYYVSVREFVEHNDAKVGAAKEALGKLHCRVTVYVPEIKLYGSADKALDVLRAADATHDAARQAKYDAATSASIKTRAVATTATTADGTEISVAVPSRNRNRKQAAVVADSLAPAKKPPPADAF